MAACTVLRSILSEKVARITGILLTPYIVCVDVKPTPLIVLDITSKFDGDIGGDGVGSGDEDLLH